MNVTTAIQAMESKLEALSLLKETRQFNVWQKETVLTLINIYGESDKRIRSFEEIQSYQNFGFTGIDRFAEAKNEAESILKSLIKDISDFGINKSESKPKSGGVNVHVNQHNNQNQTTNVSIELGFLVEILKDELKGGQVKELKSIIESDEAPDVKKKSFTDKIKSFGLDVTSNILANILTNPKVYEQIGGML